MISCVAGDNISKKNGKKVYGNQSSTGYSIAVLLLGMDITQCLATVSRQKERREETFFPFEQA
jgi:hypothetical protein